ncbi:MAG TPA: TIGR03067 domain-containing protein [Terriglobia bacterium]|nr:TIGR03067 domain-containing protein [Terriglobia bacterium]
MTKRLPARPHLEHLRTQAKTLLSQLMAGGKEAATSFIAHLPAARSLTVAKLRESKFKLADAQSVVARQNGFASWPALVRHVEQLRDMEGTWAFVNLEIDGNALPASAFTHSRMLIDGDRFRMESPEATYEGIFTIDVENLPHKIDIEFIAGPEAGNWSYGIFELKGDAFKICLGLTGASRPHGFSTTPGSGHALENLRRVVRNRPEGVQGGTPHSQPTPKQTASVDASAFDVPMTPLLSKLQGEWIPTQLIQNGQPMQTEFLPFGSRSFAGNETKVVFGGQIMLHAKMRIDESRSPIAVDYLDVGKSSTGQISLGIMDWTGDEVWVCMSAPGQPRAVDFSCEPASGRTLSVWKRKQ